MKLLSRLRGMLYTDSLPVMVEQEEEPALRYLDLEMFEEEEHYGVGAAVLQDVADFEFFDSFRRRSSEVNEEVPPQGWELGDFAMDYDA